MLIVAVAIFKHGDFKLRVQHRGRVPIVTAALSKRSQNKAKNVLDHGRNKHRSVYNKGRECPGSEKTALNKQREELVSQNKTVI